MHAMEQEPVSAIRSTIAMPMLQPWGQDVRTGRIGIQEITCLAQLPPKPFCFLEIWAFEDLIRREFTRM